MLSSICVHVGFVDAQSFAAFGAQHGLVLRRQHGHNVHARWIVPDEERLVGLLGVVAVKEVDDLRRNSRSTVFERSRVSGPSSCTSGSSLCRR